MTAATMWSLSIRTDSPSCARKDADPETYLRIKGAGRLAPRNLAVLRELHAWRERRAAASDVPAFKILSAEILLALAANPPRDLGGLGQV